MVKIFFIRRCCSHAADGSLKRLANSKTMNLSEVTEFLPSFRKIMKHFKLSGTKKIHIYFHRVNFEVLLYHFLIHFFPTLISKLSFALHPEHNLKEFYRYDYIHLRQNC